MISCTVCFDAWMQSERSQSELVQFGTGWFDRIYDGWGPAVGSEDALRLSGRSQPERVQFWRSRWKSGEHGRLFIKLIFLLLLNVITTFWCLCVFSSKTVFFIYFKGVNMKGAILEESNMAGVNLRVGTLKYANLQNCTLRGAVLAGADLEVKKTF